LDGQRAARLNFFKEYSLNLDSLNLNAFRKTIKRFSGDPIPMKVILTKDVDSLGDSGELMSVSDGYARNFLLPKNLAIPATPGALKDLQSRIERIKAKAEKKHQEDLGKASQIVALGILTLEANVGENGKLFGAITTKELAKIISDKTSLELDRKNLSLDHPINRTGDYSLHIKFSAKVSQTLPVKVVSASGPEEFAPQGNDAEGYES
jgi:large subunit ribosomal protein L9